MSLQPFQFLFNRFFFFVSDAFINKSSVLYDEACERFDILDGSILKLKRHFGEILMANNFEIDDDPWSSFFSTLVQFALMHKTASIELINFERRRLQQASRDASMEERKKQQEAKRKKEQINDTTNCHDDDENGGGVSTFSTPPSRKRLPSDELRVTSLPRRTMGSPRSPMTPSGDRKIAKVNICDLFKERMLALNGAEESDSDDEW